MTNDLRKLDTFLIPPIHPNRFNKSHLHVAVTNPFDSGNGIPQILLVSISSVHSSESDYDKTCILEPRDHPFIRHDSYVVYKYAAIFEQRNLERKINNGLIRRKVGMSKDVGERIIKGVEKSLETKNHIIVFFRETTGAT